MIIVFNFCMINAHVFPVLLLVVPQERRKISVPPYKLLGPACPFIQCRLLDWREGLSFLLSWKQLIPAITVVNLLLGKPASPPSPYDIYPEALPSLYAYQPYQGDLFFLIFHSCKYSNFGYTRVILSYKLKMLKMYNISPPC